MVLPGSGCCCLGIPSQRFDLASESSTYTGVLSEGGQDSIDLAESARHESCDEWCEDDITCCDETGCDGSSCGQGFGFRAWLAEQRQKRNGPTTPRFHPVPTKPVFTRVDWTQEESELIYGRFGTIEVQAPPELAP